MSYEARGELDGIPFDAPMIKHKNRIDHDPSNGQYGDCHRACVATVLGLDPDDVPHFYGDPAKDGNAIIAEFLATMGLSDCTVYYPGETDLSAILATVRNTMPGVPIILGGRSRTGCNHSVVLLDGEIYNDPAETGILGPLDNGYYCLSIIAALPNFAGYARTLRAKVFRDGFEAGWAERLKQEANNAAVHNDRAAGEAAPE